MNIKENKINESIIEVIFDLDRSDIEKDLILSAKKISEKIEIKGFRKGFAPYDLVCSKVGGEDVVYEDARDKIISENLAREIKNRKIDFLGNPKIEDLKITPPFGISFKAKIFLAPKVVLGDISKIKEKKKEIKITEEEVQKVIDDLREMRVKEVFVSREAKKNDKVVLDFEIKDSGVSVENGKSQSFPLVLGEGRFIPGFEENIVGMKSGDEKKFKLKFPDNYFENSLKGKEADFEVKVIQVFERILPDFDDDFAKNFGDCDSKECLKKMILENLSSEAQRRESERFEVDIMSKLVEISKISEISDEVVEQEAYKMIGELEADVVSRGVDFEDYVKSIKTTKEKLILDFKPKALERIKFSAVASEFGRVESVFVSDADVKKEIDRAKSSYSKYPERLSEIESPRYFSYVKHALLSKAIFEKLAEKVLNNQ